MQSVIDKLKQLATEMKDRSHYAYLFVEQLEEIIGEIENPWRPIEDVPKNDWVLLRGGTTDEDDYGNEVGKDIGRPVVGMWDESPFEELAFKMCYWDGNWRSHYINPTHWQPISQPPREGE